MINSRVPWYKYKLLSLCVKLFSYLHLINKSSKIQHIKRKYLIKAISDIKLISETSGAAHTLYHPNKTSDEVNSIKKYLDELIRECKSRGLNDLDIILWAEEIMNSDYFFNEKKHHVRWAQDINRLNDFYKILNERTTIRNVEKQSFDKELIYKLISSAIEAPSSCNKQGWRFVIIDDPKIIDGIAKIKKQSFIKDFPYIIVCCFDKEAYRGLDCEMTPYLDCGGAIMNLVNSSTALGIGSCWCNFAIKNIGKKAHNNLRSLIKLPKSIIPVSIVGIGIPSKINKKPCRNNLKFYLILENKKW